MRILHSVPYPRGYIIVPEGFMDNFVRRAEKRRKTEQKIFFDDAVPTFFRRPAFSPDGSMLVVPTGHILSAADEITAADLDDEPTLLPEDDVVGWGDAPGVLVEHRPETTLAAIELVAAGIGVLIVPQSLARLYHRKDLTYRPIADAPTCPVASLLKGSMVAGMAAGHRGALAEEKDDRPTTAQLKEELERLAS